MLYSDLKTSVRSITRNKVQSAISILGLGIGLGCIILLLALILHENSFDRYIPDHQNVHRIIFGNSGATQYPLAEEMKREFPEVTDFFRFYQTNNIQLRNQRNELVRDGNFAFSDPSIFRILGIEFTSGSAAVSLNEVAISQKTAFKYFGQCSPLGAVMPVKLNEVFTDMIVSGVYKDFPSNSTLFPDFIADIKLSEKMFSQFQRALGDFGNETRTSFDWRYGEFLSVVVLDRNADIDALILKMEKYKELFVTDKTKDLKFNLQAVSDTYLKSGDIGNLPFLRSGNSNELMYYEAIALLILLISVINYILLTRAGTADRLRELGTRKAFGATNKLLRRQILLESNLVAILSLIPASFVIDYGMTFINDTLNKTLNYEVFYNPFTWLILISVVIFTGTGSGVLIGYNFSRIPALLLLSGKQSESARSNRWTYSFLIFHFSIYIILVASVISVSKQIRFSRSSLQGINPENILVSELNSPELKKSFTAITDEIQKIPGVIKVAGGSFIPPFGNFLPITLATVEGEKVRFDGLIMGNGMTELLGIELKEGQSFGEYQPGTPEILMNESGALKHNVKAGENFLVFKVRGILKDFNAHSLHSLIEPMVILQQNPQKMGLIAIKTDGTNDAVIKDRLRQLYNQIAPDEIFEVTYLSERVSSFYSRERNQAEIMGAFSFLATVLSMMGLFGIALISISKRTKEVGVRKVNGASISEVLYLLNVGFIRWVLISIVISVPASVYIMSQWLERFAYRTGLSWWIFASASLSAILIALITVSYQSMRAATRNPVEALRYE